MPKDQNAIDYEAVGAQTHGTSTPTWLNFYQLETRVRTSESQTEALDRKLELGAHRFADIERRIEQHCVELRTLHAIVEAHNNHVTEMKQLLEDIKAMLQVFESARGTVTVLSAMGGLLKWLTGIGAALIMLWAWFNLGIK